MRFTNIKSIRPLTKLMIQLLKDCRTRELSNLEPLEYYDTESLKGLSERGLLSASTVLVNGKKEVRYSITSLGKEYLNHYFPESKIN